MAQKLEFSIRKATPDDAEDLIELIKELAIFEKFPDAPEIDAKILAHDLERKACFAFIAKYNEECAGLALYYLAYSTWQGQCIHLEDLYIRPKFRRNSLGKKLIQEVAKEAYEKKYKRISLIVFDWNQNARNLYSSLNAIDLSKDEGWLVYRFDEERIKKLALNSDL
uniref:N-acetyltransferase domain-containing protein n=1 Tax=Acrobeloides nanus TaxID=290746 RepID=A0A914CTL4_9BILA